MNGVVTLEVAAREQMNSAVEAATAKFQKSIAPIYGSSPQGNPIHIGTCNLISWKSKRLLITAAHIIDENEHSSLYVGVDGELKQIRGSFKCTGKPEGLRERDHFDFAWLELENEDILRVSAGEFLSDQDVTCMSGHNPKALYLALGYPNSKNKKLQVAEKSIKPQVMRYSSLLKPMPELCKSMGVTGEHHFFLAHDRRKSKDPDGNVVNTLKPTGSSGGALIKMGQITSPEALFENRLPQAKLVGVLIENPRSEGVLIAVSIGLILDQVEKNAL